jgi:chemotaxis signal transduction protein
MTSSSTTKLRSTETKFVLFPIGKKRFALPADEVTELAQPDRLQTFPHTTPLLAGVLVRRGRVVPVFDAAQILVGPNAPARKFYLIVTRHFDKAEEWTAVPVSGECELTTRELLPRTARLPEYVTGLLDLNGGEIVEVLDMKKLASAEVA